MMKLPTIKLKKVLKTLKKFEFEIKRKTGSHARLIHPMGEQLH